MKKSEALVIGTELAIVLSILLPPLYRSGQKEAPWLREALCWILFWPLWVLRWAGVSDIRISNLGGVSGWILSLLGVVSWGLAFGYALFWVVSRVRKRGKRHAL